MLGYNIVLCILFEFRNGLMNKTINALRQNVNNSIYDLFLNSSTKPTSIRDT